MPDTDAPTAAQATEKYVPKHRAVPARTRAVGATGRAARKGVLLGSAAVVATGVGVGSGVVMADGPALDAAGASAAGASIGDQVGPGSGDAASAGDDAAPELTAEEQQELLSDRGVVSRSDRRDKQTNVKKAALGADDSPAVTVVEDLGSGDPRDVAKALLPEYGFSQDQFGCLDSLYVSESNWRIDADNPSSSAYGIPQAMTSLHDLPADYYTSAEAQIRWGLEYIQRAYGTPCSAWDFKAGHGWY